MEDKSRDAKAAELGMTICRPNQITVPDDTHTVVAITDHYYGVARLEGQVQGHHLPQALVTQAISNMVLSGGKRSWGYAVYAFGPGLTFEGVHQVWGSVHWVADSQEVLDAGTKPSLYGVRGPRTQF